MRAIIIGLALIIPGYAVADDYPQPGLYKLVAKVSSDKLPISSSHDSTQCIESEHFRTNPNSWMKDQQGQECEVTKYEISGGTMQMEMQCMVQGSGAATITGNGSYTSDSFQMENNMRMNANGMTMDIKTVVTATLQGSC